MPSGVQIWDEDGGLILDTSTVVVRFFGSVDIGGEGAPQTGSLVEPRFAQGTPFYMALNRQGVDVDGLGVVVSFQGNAMWWSYPSPGSSVSERPVSTLLYGVYSQ